MLELFSKINIRRIVAGNYSTYGDEYGRGKWMDVLLFLVMPGLFGVAYYYGVTRWTLKLLGACSWSAACSVSAIFIPLVLTMLTCLLASKDKHKNRSLALLKNLCTNCSYCVVVALLLLLYVGVVYIFDWSKDVRAAAAAVRMPLVRYCASESMNA